MIKTLRAKNLSKKYGKKTVIRDISFEIKQGEVVGLLGPNGAGKTTCFYMVVGLVKVGQGNIFIDDLDITKMPMYQRARLGIGYLPQEASIFRGMNVEDNIYSILEIVEPNKAKRDERLNGLLENLTPCLCLVVKEEE
jgi:lipopolysaccharide export system ATP-binding protein